MKIKIIIGIGPVSFQNFVHKENLNNIVDSLIKIGTNDLEKQKNRRRKLD
jgi:hypothetical protein